MCWYQLGLRSFFSYLQYEKIISSIFFFSLTFHLDLLAGLLPCLNPLLLASSPSSRSPFAGLLHHFRLDPLAGLLHHPQSACFSLCASLFYQSLFVILSLNMFFHFINVLIFFILFFLYLYSIMLHHIDN